MCPNLIDCSSSLCVIDFEAPVSSDPAEGVTENDLRRKRLASTDVVYSVDLLAVFQQEIINLRARLGDTAFYDLLSTVDVETMANVKAFMGVGGL